MSNLKRYNGTSWEYVSCKEESRWGDISGTLSSQADLNAILTALRSDVDAKELSSNKVTTLTSSSTDTQYPSAKVTFDELTGIKQTLIPINSTMASYHTLTSSEYTYLFDTTLGLGNVATLDYTTV